MKVVYRRSQNWLMAEQVRRGCNLSEYEEVEVDPAALSKPVRAAIISEFGQYPETLPGMPRGGGTVEFAADHVPADMTPEIVDALIAEAIARHAAEKEAREEQCRREHAAQEPLIRRFLDDPAARPSDHDHAHHRIELEGVVIDRTHRMFETLRAEAERRAKADIEAVKAQYERERAAKEERLTAQIAAWVAAKGTPNQASRWAEGLLPKEEVLEQIRAEALAPGMDLPRYEKITPDDVFALCKAADPQCPGGQKVDFTVDTAASLSADQYSALVAVRSAFPGADVSALRHEASWDCGCPDCPVHMVERFGAKVHAQVGEVHAVAEYAL